MWGDFFTKPLQGSPYRKMRAVIMNIPETIPLPITSTGSKECVGAPSYADVVRGTDRTVVNQLNQKVIVAVKHNKR
jgi:hypothetical protein